MGCITISKYQHLTSSQVEGPRNHGVAQVHMVKLPGHSDYEYQYLFVDVKGHERVYLENSEANRSAGKKAFTMFGVKWS